MKVSACALLALALPLAATGERYLVICGNGNSGSPCSPSILKALTDAGATLIGSYEFGVAVIDADEDLSDAVSGCTVTLDGEVGLEKSVVSPIDSNDIVPRLETTPPPFTNEDGKYMRSSEFD
jgi:hypothetical protein